MPVSVVCDTTSAVAAAIRDSIATSSSANGICSVDDSQSLQSKLVASAKRVLLSKIEYEEVNSYSHSVLDTLKSKYIVLKPSNSTKLNHSNGALNGGDKDSNQNQCNAANGPRNPNQLSPPKRILYARENVQIGWKSSGRKWQVGAGMINVGNTCYLNSTLQALFHVPAMANWLMSDSVHREKCEDESGAQGGCIICAMSKTLIYSQTNQNPIRPYLVYTKLRLVCKHLIMGRQEDAHEFLRYLVEAMEKSYLSRFRNSKELDQYSKETTPLNQILGGYLKSAVRCLACGHVSTTFQHFQDLLLDIRKANTLEEALDGYFARERLEDMGYKCEACKKKVTATKQFSLERAPISLCIQLKRFSMMGSKLNKHLSIRPRLDLSPYASKTNREQLSYKLVAMVTHLGASQHCGHYTAIGLTESGTYYQFDDSYVRPISLPNVLNTNAYVIFYELDDSHDQMRQTSTQVSREHGESSLKELSKMDIKSTVNENSLQRQNSLNRTNNTNMCPKIISKLETNQPTSLIGPQLPSKMQQQRNSPTPSSGSTNGDYPKSSPSSKLVNSQSSPLKLSNGNASNSTSSNGFQSPSSHKGNCNQNLNSKVVIHLKNGPSTSTNSKFSYSNKQQDRSESNGNCDKGQLNGIRSTQPNTPKLYETSKIKQSSRPGDQTPTKPTNGMSNGYLKSYPSTSGTKHNNTNSNHIKSLVPYESDDDSDDANDVLTKGKDYGGAAPPITMTSSKSKKRSYESDNESSATSDADSTPPPTKIRLTPPSTPIIKTKAGLWKVTDIEEPRNSYNENSYNSNNNSSKPNNGWKNPFTSSASSCVAGGLSSARACDMNNSSNRFNEKKSPNKKYGESNGTTQNGTVRHLMKFSHRGYGAPVLTWNGQRTAIEKEVIEEIRQERNRDLHDEEENEMDRGRQKKMKTHNGFMNRDNPGYNPFQEYQNHQNQNRRWNNSGPYRPYRPNYYNRNNNFRRNNFHKRPHHQRNGGGSSGGGGNYHHRRTS